MTDEHPRRSASSPTWVAKAAVGGTEIWEILRDVVVPPAAILLGAPQLVDPAPKPEVTRATEEMAEVREVELDNLRASARSGGNSARSGNHAATGGGTGSTSVDELVTTLRQLAASTDTIEQRCRSSMAELDRAIHALSGSSQQPAVEARVALQQALDCLRTATNGTLPQYRHWAAELTVRLQS